MMFEAPGKITNLNFQVKNSQGKWITRYTIRLDKQPTYKMVYSWLSCFVDNPTKRYRLTTIQEHKHKNEDGTTSIENREETVLSPTSSYLNVILSECQLITIKTDSPTDTCGYKVFSSKNDLFPSFKDFWKAYIWNRVGDDLVKVKMYARTKDDDYSQVYKLIFESGYEMTIACWNTFP